MVLYCFRFISFPVLIKSRWCEHYPENTDRVLNYNPVGVIVIIILEENVVSDIEEFITICNPGLAPKL